MPKISKLDNKCQSTKQTMLYLCFCTKIIKNQKFSYFHLLTHWPNISATIPIQSQKILRFFQTQKIWDWNRIIFDWMLLVSFERTFLEQSTAYDCVRGFVIESLQNMSLSCRLCVLLSLKKKQKNTINTLWVWKNLKVYQCRSIPPLVLFGTLNS